MTFQLKCVFVNQPLKNIQGTALNGSKYRARYIMPINNPDSKKPQEVASCRDYV